MASRISNSQPINISGWEVPVNSRKNQRDRDNVITYCRHEDDKVVASINNTPGSLNHGGHVLFNWQAGKATVKERLAFIFNKEILSDVHFIVGKGAQLQRIPAHKFVLSVGSAVFDDMFNGAMATSSGEIDLPDVEPAAFLALLRFLYSDEVQIGPETVMTTLYTAKKYAVPALEKACVDFLKSNLSSDNAFMLLTEVRLFDEPQLAALCLETIDKCTSEALAAEGITDIDRDTLCAVLERETLQIREAKLFNVVVSGPPSIEVQQTLLSQLTPSMQLNPILTS
ncbi:BTB/POZ domain-containing protein 2-like [Limulus polyphemus]|uniref:BTB/POZ domain-containing protein 2-like n=1 Tax=Limulus polyphemus TaxID=6850 RepID=A0ABM1SNG5_LIMPO|nr:BTB/POZ domain-containing protein 2-like [Limulus polyphemus]XP_022245170.1 BTB/POZ domain-containing protein 2-like [Limulus polyphemus]XP_022245171.1 BTB/POZ domain-containing protein 2-like [Limulus polyphemus]